MSRYLTLALGLCLAYNVALATGTATFETIDIDADGQITMDEAKSDPDLFKAFGGLDVDGDGFLTLVEYSAVEANDES